MTISEIFQPHLNYFVEQGIVIVIMRKGGERGRRGKEKGGEATDQFISCSGVEPCVIIIVRFACLLSATV